MLAKNGQDGDYSQDANVADITNSVVALSSAQSSLSALEAQLSEQLAQLQRAKSSGASNSTEADALEQAVAKAQRDLIQLTDQASGLEQVLEKNKRAAISVGDADERDDEVGGIPVDSDYVVFIIDTSGSMKSMWRKVLQSVEEVLNNHPEVKGFQVLSDNGEYLFPASAGRWQSDTSAKRRLAINVLRSWNGSSNSSPVEGIEGALRVYGKRPGSLALYVFGDDYSGGSYDKTLANINALNTNAKGQKVARIHAIGFRRAQRNLTQDSVKFATLMTEVARQNRGTFISK